MRIIYLEQNGWKQPFWVARRSDGDKLKSINLSVETKDILQQKPSSFVIRTNTPQQKILKAVASRRFLERIKLLWWRSRITKEVRGRRMMDALGIRTARIELVAYGLLPSLGYRFTGFYIMEDLHQLDFRLAKQMIKILPPEYRQSLLDNIIHDMKKMRDAKMVFDDFKLGNIFCNDVGDIIWIDTGVSIFPFRKNKFQQNFDVAIDRFMKRHHSLLDVKEKCAIESLKFG